MYYLAVDVSNDENEEISRAPSNLLFDEKTNAIYKTLLQQEDDIDSLVHLRDHLNEIWETDVYITIRQLRDKIVKIKKLKKKKKSSGRKESIRLRKIGKKKSTKRKTCKTT